MVRYYFFILLILFLFKIDLSALSTVKENLGSAINSTCDEISPVISPDGKTLYFCRSYCRGNIGLEDIWVSHLGETGDWTRAVNAGSSINIGKSNFASSILDGGNTILLGSAFDDNGNQKEGVSITKRAEIGWSKPVNLTIKNYYNLDKSNSFFLSSDGNTLLMTIRREDSYGSKDIYVSFILDDGTWTEPMNIGDAINTKGDEISPFLASDGISLYFSSDGHQGYGSADVFVSRRLDDTWVNWSKPINLGAGINTEDWDAFYRITAKGDVAYFVSNKDSYGQSDIFSIKVPEKVRPNTVALIKGTIKDAKNNLPIEAKINVYSYPENKIETQATSNKYNGEYTFTVAIGDVYDIKIEAPDYQSFDNKLDISDLKNYDEFQRDFEITPEIDSILLIKNILFKLGNSELDHNSNVHIKYIADFLIINPEYFLEIIGHTDDIGTLKKNEKIAKRRAENAAKLFYSEGVSKESIKIISRAFNSPIATNKTEEGRAINRRVEFVLRKKQ